MIRKRELTSRVSTADATLRQHGGAKHVLQGPYFGDDCIINDAAILIGEDAVGA